MQKCPTDNEIHRSVKMLTKYHQQWLYQAVRMQRISCSTPFMVLFLILSSHLRLVHFTVKFCVHLPFLHVCYKLHPYQPPLLQGPKILDENHKFWSYSVQFSRVSSSLLGPNIPLYIYIYIYIFRLFRWRTKFHTHTQQPHLLLSV